MIMLSRLKSPAKRSGFYWREKIVHMTEAEPAKKHVFCSDGMVAGMGCKTLACALAVRVLRPKLYS